MAQKPLIQHETFRKDSDILNVIIETPRGSRIKYSYDPEHELFEVRHVLPEGSTFPYDFGFLPSTTGGDGDPLDVLVLLDAPATMGCLATARLIGVIEAEQTEDGKTTRNDRLLAVAVQSKEYAEVRSIDGLRPGLLDEVEHFFKSYNELRGKQFKPLRRGGPNDALEVVRKGQREAKR